jgi:hypothetical protein
MRDAQSDQQKNISKAGVDHYWNGLTFSEIGWGHRLKNPLTI